MFLFLHSLKLADENVKTCAVQTRETVLLLGENPPRSSNSHLFSYRSFSFSYSHISFLSRNKNLYGGLL